MTRIIHYLNLIICLASVGVLSSQIVKTSGRSILVNGEKYVIRGTCYSPHSIGSQWFDYPDLGFPTYASFARDIELMNAACINTIRTYYPIFDQTRLDQLNAAGIKVIIQFPRQDLRSGVNSADRYEMINGTYRNYINRFKNHPAILMWCFGNEVNYYLNQYPNWYAELENAAQWTKANDPNHPVTTANGEVPTNTMMVTQCPSVDVWGANIYRFGVANTPLNDYVTRGGVKPFWYSEIGVDSYNHLISRVDEAIQASQTVKMWGDIQYSIDNNGICSGATFFNWTDEWWKSGSPSTQNQSGFAPSGAFFPDQRTDEEYYGILNQNRTPKQVYYSLQSLWSTNCMSSNPATFVLEDFECNRHLGYINYDGGFEIVNNPRSSTINNSAKCVKYTRSAVQYAALIGLTPTFSNASSFATKVLHPTLDVYSSKVGVVVTLNLESSTDLGDPYPKGRYAVYTATTTKANEWETLKFVLQGARDATVDPLKVNRVSILFNAGVTADNDIYYFDNLKGPTVSKFTDLSITSFAAPSNSTSCVPKENLIRVIVKNNSAETVNFANTRVDVSAVVTGAKNQNFITRIETGSLAANATREVLITDQLDLSLKGNYGINVNVHAPGDNLCANNTLPALNLVSDICLGVNENLESSTFEVYPNPTSGDLFVKVNNNEIISIQIFSKLGDLIQTVNDVNSDEIQLGLGGLNSGVYFLKIETSNQSITKKLEVIH